MASLTIFLVTCLLVKGILSDIVTPCPKTCSCNSYTDVSSRTSEVRVDCIPSDSKRGIINHVPSNLPRNVTHLLLDNNVLDHLSQNVFSDYSELKTLSLRGNVIRTVEHDTFANLKNLKNLDLGGNVIERIDDDVFKDVPKLETLNLDGNRLKSVPVFAPLSALTKINLASNNFSDCTLPAEVASPKLQSVTLSGNICNSLSSSTFANLALYSKQLTSLAITNTHVSFISSDAFTSLTSLEELDLSTSKSLNWTVIQRIVYPPKLRTLYLENVNSTHSDLTDNYISFLPISLQTLKISYCGLTGVMPDFRHLTNLTYLSVEGNEFTAFPKIAGESSMLPPSIEHFFARNNKINNVPVGAFSNLRNLQSVDLSYNNKIQPFHPMAFGDSAPSVTDLVLTQALAEFPMGLLPTLPNLQRLTLDENSFNQLDGSVRNDFDKLTKLTKLDLTGNELKELPPRFLQKLTNLTHLLLNDNYLGRQISTDTEGMFFDGLQSLYSLNLEENEIFALPPKVFSRIGRELRSLDLLGNKLTKFPSDVLSNFPKLNVLNMDANEIRMLQPGEFSSIPSGAVVNLWSNPIDCSCDNYEFFRWMELTKPGVSRPSIRDIECHSPPELSNKQPPPVSRLSAICANSASSTAVLVFFVVICGIVVVVLVAWFGARKLRHYFPYKRLSPGNGTLVTTVPGVNMSGLDDTEETFQM